MTKIVALNIKKIFMIILIIVVSILVLAAFYSNKHKFGGVDTIRYMKISLSSVTNVQELAEKYSDSETKEIFVSELKKVNDISSSDYIIEKTVFIPVLK